MALYQTSEVAELLSFCRNRGLVLPSDKTFRSSGRYGIIELLEEADKNRKFDKLIELAPEMRLKIYEFYFTAFMSDIEPIAPISAVGSVPSLCHATRLLRTEALPVYFSFGVMLGMFRALSGPQHDLAARFGCMPQCMDADIMTMPTHLFQHVREITIVPGFLFTGIAKTIWTIKLDAKTAASQITTSLEKIKFQQRAYADGTESDQSAETREVERGLRMLVAEILGRDCDFRLEDMQKILDVFRETWESRKKMLDDGKLRPNRRPWYS